MQSFSDVQPPTPRNRVVALREQKRKRLWMKRCALKSVGKMDSEEEKYETAL